MPQVAVEVDEVYPVYSIREPDPNRIRVRRSILIELTFGELERFKKAEAEYDAMQEMIGKLYEKVTSK